jgi:hypothetical protein
LSTNRLPKANGQTLTYVGDLADNKYISLVETASGNYNPCVDKAKAAAPAAQRFSGPLTAVTRTVTVAASTLDAQAGGAVDVVYAVCYDDGAGDSNSLTWKDTYIRIKLSELTSFETKGVVHKTTGQIPSHKASLDYTYAGVLPGSKHISLVHAELGPASVSGFTKTYPNPCVGAIAGVSLSNKDSTHSGSCQGQGTGGRKVNSLDTEGLDTTKVFALCYASGTGNTGDVSWRDSGIRLTVSSLTSIVFSGFLEHQAIATGKKNRKITSVQAELQRVGANPKVVANVLPQMQNLPFTYTGTLAVSQYVSLVDSALNSNNPCVNPAVAAAGADSQHSGVTRGCKSFEGLCLANGEGGSTAGNKEIVVPMSVALDDSKVFTVCYSTGDGSGTDYSWRDSYVRVTISKIKDITATLVTHTVMGHMANHEDAAPLEFIYSGWSAASISANAWFSVVDQEENTNNPCFTHGAGGLSSGQSVHTAAEVVDGLCTDSPNNKKCSHSGPYRGSAGKVGMRTSTLNTLGTAAGATLDKVFAVCYSTSTVTTPIASRGATVKWYDTGIRVTISKLHTMKYNTAQLPTSRTVTSATINNKPKFQKLFTSSRAKVGIPSCVKKYGQVPTPNRACDAPVAWQGSFGTAATDQYAVGDINDGVFNEPCQETWFCNGDKWDACGTMGFCSEAIGPVAEYRTTYNTQVLHKLPQVSPPLCTAISTAGLGAVCDTDFDGDYHNTCAVGAACKAGDPDNGGCGTTGTCTAYSVSLEYVGDLNNTKYVSFIDSTDNNNDPCVLGALAAAPLSLYPNAIATGVIQAAGGTSKITLTYDILKNLDVSKTYAVCYAETDGTATDSTWRDSYLRFTISKVEAISTHGITHMTQAHVANGEKVEITYRGKLGAGKYFSLVDEHLNDKRVYPNTLIEDKNPCAHGSVAAAAKDSYHSGPVKAAAGTKKVQFDTRALNVEKNFALCYTEGDGTASATWVDSGIRTTISRVSGLQYNKAQGGTVAEMYTRTMTSQNAYPATDLLPLATNIIPSKINAKYTYKGNTVAIASNPGACTSSTDKYMPKTCTGNTGVAIDASLPAAKYLSVVDASLNGNNPCLNPEVAAATATNQLSGTLTALEKDITVPQTTMLNGGANNDKLFAVCYAHGNVDATKGKPEDQTWRDSFVRLRVSKVASIEVYDIQHVTTGDLPSKQHLTIKSVGDEFAANGFLSLVDATLNNEQPCVAAHAGKEPAETPVGATQGSEQQYSGRSATTAGSNANNKHTLPMNKLNADKTFAVCYTADHVGGTILDPQWTDSGLRVKTPEVTSITFGSPARVLTAASCWDNRADTTLANCISKEGGLPAHQNSLLPRASNVEVTYGGPEYGAGLAVNKWIALVEHQTTLTANDLTTQPNNPCRDGRVLTNDPGTSARADWIDGAGTGNQVNGGMRLRTGALQAPGGSKKVVIPQTSSVGAQVFHYLDHSKTYSVCYAETSGAHNDVSWRDSYVRVRLQKIHYIKASGVNTDTYGTVGAAPSLTFRWYGSLGYNQWLRITAIDEGDANGVGHSEPCKPGNYAQAAADGVSTDKIESQPGTSMVTFDTSRLMAGASPNGKFFAVCYAEGSGTGGDNTWTDSGIRYRVIKWTNAGKHRVTSGAPVRLTFELNIGSFDRQSDVVVLLQGQSDCSNAPSATAMATTTKVSRTFDHTCATVGGNNVTAHCDVDFDGTYNEKCTVGALCNGADSSVINGGCGTAGTCDGTVQLPTGTSYNAIHDAVIHDEERLGQGVYALCVCLGGNTAGYGAANGNGGCNDGNEFTTITSPSTPGQSLKIISMPRLGRWEELSGQQTVRHVSGLSHKYNIKTQHAGAGYQVQDGDKIYFAPKNIGCGHYTKYSGEGTHVYDHATNSYISSNVDRRWRTIAKYICTAVDTDAADTCDAKYDGAYAEECVVNAFCNPANPLNGGCGSSGTCASPIPATDAADRTAPITVANYSLSTDAAVITTPTVTKLTTVGEYVSCFATKESLSGTTDVSDFVELQDGLEVITPPRLGALNSPGHVRALEGANPSFAVNTMKYGDLIYFVPKTQTAAADVASSDADCTPTVCVSAGGSSIGSNCDTSYSGVYTDTCAFRARCNAANPHNGGCGTAGHCGYIVPSVSTSIFTGLLNGSSFEVTSGVATGKVPLPSAPFLSVPAYTNAAGSFLSAWHMAACFVPAGAIQSLPSNVKPLQDMLTVFKEPTDNLVETWYQNNVQELRFTQPQQGVYGSPTFSTGQEGDIVVLKKDSCIGVHAIDSSSYLFGQTFSAKFVLEAAGGETAGDEKGGVAGVYPLAQGKVNELQFGTYKICYATKNSGGEAQSDFKELAKMVEILPTPSMTPQITVPRAVLLGQDIVINWQANIGLQNKLAPAGTWIGLYEKGSCVTEDEWRHRCYKAYQFVPAETESGVVRFSQADYKNAGEYDVRYFVGDSRNGQGEICRGLAGVPGDTYVSCMLEPKVTSSGIHVHGPDMRDLEDLDSQVGLEVVFAGNKGRFN